MLARSWLDTSDPQNTSAYAGYGKIVQEVIGAATRPSTTGCTWRCACRSALSWPPACSRSSPCAHAQPAESSQSCQDRAIEMMDSRRVPGLQPMTRTARADDPGQQDPGGSRQPGWLEPELATLTADRLSDPAWLFEHKFDSERCLAFRAGQQLR